VNFSLIHATDRIPDGWCWAARQWRGRCDDPDQVEHIIVTQRPFVGTRIFDNTLFVSNPAAGSVPLWNAGAKFSNGNVLIGLADDLFPCEHWDSELLKVIPQLDEPYVLEVEHADNSNILSHIFETRAYYEAFGYMHHPDYVHLMADVEFGDVARTTGRLINARHLVFPHKKADQMGWAPEYERVRTNDFAIAQALYARRSMHGFPKESMLESVC
jgi:hypothetical protein